MGVLPGFVWLKIGTVLENAVMKLLFHKILGGSRVVAQPVASRVVLSSIELVS
jgi:hypothetical protein